MSGRDEKDFVDAEARADAAELARAEQAVRDAFEANGHGDEADAFLGAFDDEAVDLLNKVVVDLAINEDTQGAPLPAEYELRAVDSRDADSNYASRSNIERP
jgi:hypothetical protein